MVLSLSQALLRSNLAGGCLSLRWYCRVRVRVTVPPQGIEVLLHRARRRHPALRESLEGPPVPGQRPPPPLVAVHHRVQRAGRPGPASLGQVILGDGVGLGQPVRNAVRFHVVRAWSGSAGRLVRCPALSSARPGRNSHTPPRQIPAQLVASWARPITLWDRVAHVPARRAHAREPCGGNGGTAIIAGRGTLGGLEEMPVKLALTPCVANQPTCDALRVLEHGIVCCRPRRLDSACQPLVPP
mmetsp:Transcript_6654/g.14488  ORF Transcript_6654/g.14488 Transcript_6654/m.14488 type:complete len:242 (+) Transcript_6654:499-1224(+)